MEDLSVYRDKIDEIDSQLIKLISERNQIVGNIAEFKYQNKLPIFDSTREQSKLEAVKKQYEAVTGDDCTLIEKEGIANSFSSIMYESKKYQLTKCLKEKNIFLIGMPGCGKSTISARLSEMLGTDRLDLDEEYEKEYGLTPEMEIVHAGEPLFREKENLLLKEVTEKVHGHIISTGGGIVMTQANYQLMKDSGIIIYILRDINQLSIAGRPVSAQLGVKKLMMIRAPRYQEWSDFSVENNKPDKCVNEIIDKLLLNINQL